LLSIYNQIQFVKKIEEGGSTHPWLVQVLTEEGVIPYVVKLFTTEQVEQYNPVLKEVLANKLATEFDLEVPEPALLELNENFVEGLNNDLREEISNRDKRTKFATRYIEDAPIFSLTLPEKSFERYEIENIYAFDFLINNVDRREIKPNLLVNDHTAYLIDHELSLSINEEVIQAFEERRSLYHKERHIFYPYLKQLNSAEKHSCFDTFHEYLRKVDIAFLEPFVERVRECDHSISEWETIRAYLQLARDNSFKFIQILRQSIA
jgi:hypothetical protein